MILIDTSAWVEFLRDTGSAVCDRVDDLLDGEFATCHPIRMELLAGARDERHLGQLRGLLARAVLLPTPPAHYESAAALYRTCRREGQTVRKLIDCLIAAHAIDAYAEILHDDHDFTVLARCTALRLDATRTAEAGAQACQRARSGSTELSAGRYRRPLSPEIGAGGSTDIRRESR